MEWKHTDSVVKKMFWAHQSLKKVMLTVFWDMKGLITIDFPQKGAALDRVSYSQGKIHPFIELLSYIDTHTNIYNLKNIYQFYGFTNVNLQTRKEGLKNYNCPS